MQTRTYGDLFKLIQSLAGVGEFAPSEQDDIANLINRRFLQAFNESPIWPRYLVPSEERKISSFVVSGVTDSPSTYNTAYYKYGVASSYNSAAIVDSDVFIPINKSSTTVFFYKNASSKWVFASGSFDQSTVGSNSTNILSATAYFTQNETDDHNSPLDVLDWVNNGSVGGQLVLNNANLIPYEETIEKSDSSLTFTSKTTIGTFNRIHRKKSFLNNSSIEYDFYVDFTGANILNVTSSTDNSAFVTYKQQFTPFDVTSGYGDSTVEVPGEFFAYLAHATYADFLRMDGQTEKAFAEEQRAEISLALELEKIDIISNNNTVNKRFSTYVNRQSR
jgi:hypothetical protein